MPKLFTGAVSRPEQQRFRVSVPETDESVLTWIGAQSNLSASMRTLIRDAIRRDGFRDATCYPVEQQPRRGRPPKSQVPDFSADEQDNESESVNVASPQSGSVVASDTGNTDNGFDDNDTAVSDDRTSVSHDVPESRSQARSVEAMLGSMRN